MKPIRTATINHNEFDSRIKLVLEKDGAGYVWRTEDGEDCCVSPQPTVAKAMAVAKHAWGAQVWDFRARWA